MAKTKAPPRTDNEIRHIVLRYFFDRNHNARSARSDKTGAAVKISVVYRELKASHQLTQPEIRRNLTYLISQKYIDEISVTKSVPLKTGTVIPQETSFYRISAQGIDKVAGETEFTVPKFQGININATGQNIITLGDNNQVDARYESIGNKLIEFKDAVREAADVDDSAKLSIVADVDSMQSQLAKPEPNRPVLRAIWAGIEKLTTATSLAANVADLAPVLRPLLG